MSGRVLKLSFPLGATSIHSRVNAELCLVLGLLLELLLELFVVLLLDSIHELCLNIIDAVFNLGLCIPLGISLTCYFLFLSSWSLRLLLLRLLVVGSIKLLQGFVVLALETGLGRFVEINRVLLHQDLTIICFKGIDAINLAFQSVGKALFPL